MDAHQVGGGSEFDAHHGRPRTCAWPPLSPPPEDFPGRAAIAEEEAAAAAAVAANRGLPLASVKAEHFNASACRGERRGGGAPPPPPPPPTTMEMKHPDGTVAAPACMSMMTGAAAAAAAALDVAGQLRKAKSSRRNAWGNQSYADLITRAIESTPEKRLTLSQIYDWMVRFVPYFKDKGDSNSSAGWKIIWHRVSPVIALRYVGHSGVVKMALAWH
ncbi:unnamed protein product [Merluccius merluccius]